jgi:uncharacterized protein YegP (UPF0339 family)
MYKAQARCLKGIASVQTNTGNAGRFDGRQKEGGRPYFVLKSINGQVIGRAAKAAKEVRSNRKAYRSSPMRHWWRSRDRRSCSI